MKKKLITPNQTNYFSNEIARQYISNSQIKAFFGTPVMPGCQAAAMASINGDYKQKKTVPLLVGGYVDAYFEGTIESFRQNNPEIFTQKGELYAQYKQADEIIEFAKKDHLFMRYISGKVQIILTGEIYGLPFIGKIDSLHPNAIVDLKVMADMESKYSQKDKMFINFIDAWGIADQLAIYQELERQNSGIEKPCFVAVLTKEKQPDKELINIPQQRLDAALMTLDDKVIIIDKIKRGEQPPERCGKCDYCKSTKTLTKIKSYHELILF